MVIGRATSFLSEHSVEYVIVPRAVSVLRGSFDNVIPLYFWKSREGGALSLQLNANVTVRVLALFPRRPKLVNFDDYDSIYGKINTEIFDFSAKALGFGIPVAVALPLVRNMLQLGVDPKIAWVRVDCGDVDAHSEGDVHLIFNDEKGLASLDGFLPKSVGIMEESDLPRMVTSNCTLLTWGEAAEAMSELRVVSESHRYALRLFGGGVKYRPVYLVVAESN